MTSFNRLQLRRFQEPTRYQDGPVIKRRPLKYHPQAIALHRESRSIIVQYDKDVEFVSDYGWGKRHAVNLPDDRVVSGITTWQAKVEPSSEDDHKWKEEHDILLEGIPLCPSKECKCLPFQAHAATACHRLWTRAWDI